MFKVLALTLTNHSVLPSEKITLTDQGEKNAELYTSLLLGENGTGKSQLLTCLVDIFVFLNEYSKDPIKTKWDKDYTFKIEVFKSNKKYTIDYDDDESLANITTGGNILPESILANAYTFNDKFLWRKDKDFYKYGGIRTTSNNIFVQRPSEDTFRNLCTCIQDKNRINLLSEIFNELKLEHVFKVRYESRRYKSLFTETKFTNLIETIQLTHEIGVNEIEEFKDIIRRVTSVGRNSRSIRYQDEKINKVIKENGEHSITSLLQYLAFDNQADPNYPANLNLNSKTKRSRTILQSEFLFSWGSNLQAQNVDFITHIFPYKILSDLDVISFIGLDVFRKGFIDTSNVSSGEFHLLHLYTFLVANLRESSLVLLDEPEISLHPNWQHKFFKLTNPIIEKYPETHFIIASHSHFLISDLKKASSSILTLTRNEEDVVVAKNLDKINPFGWSAEQILFEVFNLSSDRNYYLSNLVEDIVKELSKNKKNETVLNEKIKLLKTYKSTLEDLKDIDPMKDIVKQIFKLWPGENQAR